VIAEFRRAGIDVEQLAADLQREGVAAFSKSWHEVLELVAAKSRTLARTRRA
jgi:transaldolase